MDDTEIITTPHQQHHFLPPRSDSRSWVFSLQPARVGSGKLGEGMINQHSMFLLGFF